MMLSSRTNTSLLKLRTDEGRQSAGFAPGVRKLYAAQRTLATDHICHSLDASDLIVAPYTRAIRTDSSIRLDTTGFDEDEAGTF